MAINSYQEAVSLYSICKTNCRQSERALQDALAEMQHAVRKFRRAQSRLTGAELRVGKARYLIRQSGFGEALRIRSRHECMSSSKSWWIVASNYKYHSENLLAASGYEMEDLYLHQGVCDRVKSYNSVCSVCSINIVECKQLQTSVFSQRPYGKEDKNPRWWRRTRISHQKILQSHWSW